MQKVLQLLWKQYCMNWIQYSQCDDHQWKFGRIRNTSDVFPGEAILQACEPETRAASLCLRTSKDSRQKIQKQA